MRFMGKALGPTGYDVIQMPQNDEVIRKSFASLPQDPYYEGRLRRFSQFILFYEHDQWTSVKLQKRPFIQSKKYNQKIGGVERHFEPIEEFDPNPYFATIAERLNLDKNDCFQVNFHNWRTLVGGGFKGSLVPEGAHRDGHHITSVTIWDRHNIKGGDSQILSIASRELQFQTLLENGKCLIMSDPDVIHGATDIEVVDDQHQGYRDTWVISMNPWEDRRYGVEFEAMAKGA